MRVLVVGGTGFIGAALCRELHGRGHDVTALSRDPTGGDLPAGVDRVAGDVSDYDSVAAAFEGQNAVVNLVALSPLFRPMGGNEMHFTVHRDGTEHVVRAAEAHGVGRIVQMSGLGASPDAGTAYLQSKGEAERIVRDSDLEWTIVRPSVVFGDGEEFIPYTKQLATPYLTPLPGGGRTRFQPIWIGDLAPMLADAVEGVGPETAEDAPSPEGAGEATPSDDETTTGSDADDVAASGLSGDLTPAIRPAGDGGSGPEGNPHAGKTYEIGGPEVLTLAEVAALGHAADGKPVDVVSIPMPLAKIGLSTLDHVPVGILDSLPGVPRMGSDQYRSLELDSTVPDNDVTAFGVDPADLTTVAGYLDVDPETVET